jgi:hypothetical protein
MFLEGMQSGAELTGTGRLCMAKKSNNVLEASKTYVTC